MKNVLFVLTSHSELGNTGLKTGFWIEEFASPYYHLIDNGIQVTLSSPLGGQPPIDPKSNEADFQTPATIRFNNDNLLKNILANTLNLKEISFTILWVIKNPSDFRFIVKNQVYDVFVNGNFVKKVGAVEETEVLSNGTSFKAPFS